MNTWLLFTRTWMAGLLQPRSVSACHPQGTGKHENHHCCPTHNHQGMDTPHCLESITSHNSTKQNYSLLILMLKTPSPPASPQPKSYKCLAAFYRSVQVAASSSTVVWCVPCTRQLTQGKVQSEIQPVFCFPSPELWHWHVSMWKKGCFFPTQGCSLLAKPCACRDMDA